jgi:hypothetical protein
MRFHMKRSFFALLTMFAVTLSAVSFSFAAPKNAQTETARQVNQLAAQLPNSDAVVVLDMQRLMRDVLPQVLAGKAQLINELNTKVEEINTQIGVDLRQFDQLAAGVNFKQTAPKKFDYEPLILARGKVDVAALLTAARTASKGKYRQEKSGAKTIYVFATKEILQANKPKTSTPQDEEKFNKMLSRVPAELAVTTFDANTLAIGTPVRVRETIEGKPRVSADVLALVNRKPNSIMSFGANVPAGLSQVLELGIDELSKSIDSMRQVYGSMDVSGSNTIISVATKTFKPEQAVELEQTLTGLQMLGKGLLGRMSGADKQVYARMAENAKISRANDEVMIDVQVANSDLNVLFGKN